MTISEIAKLAGVSSAAVSRYLNNGSLSKEKREQIRKVIEETKYQPSENARAMRTKKSRRVGVIVPQIDSESMPQILSGISQVMDREKYSVLLMNSEQDMEKEIHMLETFEQSQVDGLILAASVVTKRHRNAFARMPFPVVIVGQRISGFSCVFHNDFQASYDMMRYLLESGSRYPAYLGVTRKDRAAGESRYEGAGKALKEFGFCMEQIPRIQVDFTIESGYQGMEQLLQQKKKIDSVFCATDLIAAGAMVCLKEKGIRVPEDIRLSGLGHGIVADILTPRLTTVEYAYKTSGREAAEMLLEQIQKPGTKIQERMLPYRIRYQESTAGEVISTHLK